MNADRMVKFLLPLVWNYGRLHKVPFNLFNSERGTILILHLPFKTSTPIFDMGGSILQYVEESIQGKLNKLFKTQLTKSEFLLFT